MKALQILFYIFLERKTLANQLKIHVPVHDMDNLFSYRKFIFTADFVPTQVLVSCIKDVYCSFIYTTGWVIKK